MEVGMAYLLHHFWTGGTEDQYRAMLKAVHPSTGLPEGQTHHVAGPTDGGFLITAVWDSRASADRFVQGLKAKMPVEGGFDGPLEERGAEVVNLQAS
jgi:hypothetical protein